MTTDTITTIAALLAASSGWLAFAREYRAHRETKWVAGELNDMLDRAHQRRRDLQAQLSRLTDRDERGRFVKRERV